MKRTTQVSRTSNRESYISQPARTDNFGQGAPGMAVIEDIEVYRVLKLKQELSNQLRAVIEDLRTDQRGLF